MARMPNECAFSREEAVEKKLSRNLKRKRFHFCANGKHDWWIGLVRYREFMGFFSRDRSPSKMTVVCRVVISNPNVRFCRSGHSSKNAPKSTCYAKLCFHLSRCPPTAEHDVSCQRTRVSASRPGLIICNTTAYSPESNSMAECFVKGFKRDYVYVNRLEKAETVMRQLVTWFDDQALPRDQSSTARVVEANARLVVFDDRRSTEDLRNPPYGEHPRDGLVKVPVQNLQALHPREQIEESAVATEPVDPLEDRHGMPHGRVMLDDDDRTLGQDWIFRPPFEPLELIAVEIAPRRGPVLVDRGAGGEEHHLAEIDDTPGLPAARRGVGA